MEYLVNLINIVACRLLKIGQVLKPFILDSWYNRIHWYNKIHYLMNINII